MVVRLKLTDGSERTVDVVTIEARLGATPVELSFEGEPVGLRVCAPGGGERWHSFVIVPRAANVVTIGVEAHRGSGAGTGK